MPKIVIWYNRDKLRVSEPLSEDALLEMGLLSSRIRTALTNVIIERMKGRKVWDDNVIVMEAGLMPQIVFNRKAVEVEIIASDGPHWHDPEPNDTFVKDTQEQLNDALLNLLVSESLTAEGWNGSVWLLTPPGSFGDTDEAAQRAAEHPHTLPLPMTE